MSEQSPAGRGEPIDELQEWWFGEAEAQLALLGAVRAEDLPDVAARARVTDSSPPPIAGRDLPLHELQEWWAEDAERKLALVEAVRDSVAQRRSEDEAAPLKPARREKRRSTAEPEPETPTVPRLFDAGIHGPHVDAWRNEVREVLRRDVAPLVEEAEEHRRFPREAIAALGRAGLFRQRWAGGGHGDVGRAVVLAEELGYGGLGGVGVGISLHMEAVTATLTRFARTAATEAARDGALDGTLVGCMATTEQTTGSDLTRVVTTLSPTGDGRWRVEGRKWFVSPGEAADFALVLCRTDDARAERRGRVAPMGLVLVPREGLHAERTLKTVGMRSLGTARMTIDATVDADHVIGRPGTALLLASWGLTHERIGIAAGVIGVSRLAVALAATHLKRREQFGVRLFDHQGLRLRIADLHAQVELARQGLYATAAQFPSMPEHGLRASAALKVTSARLATHVVEECMHFFGGTGYLEDETPFARLWRDVRVGRLGAGSDEMMWELVAGGLPADEAAYDELMSVGR